LTHNSEPKLGAKDFERLDNWVQQFDGSEIDVKPDPNVWEQVDLANGLSFYIKQYKGFRRLQLESFKPPQQRTQQVPPNINEELQEAATMLDYMITAVKSQGIVHPGSEVYKKLEKCQDDLKKCREDNRNLSLQVLDYKNRLGLPS
jgi:hypothetical protein